MNQYVGTYENVNLKTADRERILLLMYEGAIRFAQQARGHIQEGNKAAKAERLQRVTAILDALDQHLDLERGGEVAEHLSKLYEYLTRQTTKANLTEDLNLLDEVIRLLSTLHQGWAGAVGTLRESAGPASPTLSTTVAG